MTAPSTSPGAAPVQLSAMMALWITAVAMVLGLGLLTLSGALWAQLAGLSMAQGFDRAATNVAITTGSQAAAMGTAIMLGVRTGADPHQVPAALGLRPVSPAALCVFFGAGIALQLPLAELANLLYDYVFEPPSVAEQRALSEMLTPESAWARAGVLVCLSVVVPLFEELLFRGVLLRGLLATQGRAGAILLSAALFGLCHMRPVPVVYAFAAGLGLAIVAVLTRSVFAGVAMHAGVNAVPVMLHAESLPLPGLNVPSEGVVHLPVAYSLGGLVAAGALTAAAVQLHYRRRD